MFDLSQHQQPVNALAGQPQPFKNQNALAPSGLTMPVRPMFDHTGFQALTDPNARHDFRDAFQTQMGGYQDAMRAYHDAMRGHGQPGMPVTTQPVPGQITPQAMPGQMPVAPAGMVGQSYAVQGMTPATSPYGLPTY